MPEQLPPAAYEAARGHMRTGDVILFRDGPPLSWALQCTHVGMVYRDSATDILQLWESAWRGVALRPLSTVVARYKGLVWWRKLMPEADPAAIAGWARAYRKYNGLPYERNPLEFLGAWGRWIRITWPCSKGSLFCSELVAATHQEMGVVGNRWPADEYSPDAYWSSEVDFTDNYSLMHAQRIN